MDEPLSEDNVDERFAALVADARGTSDGLAHIADHVGMGNMRALKGVNEQAVCEVFARLSPTHRVYVVKGLMDCPW